ncbi:unnamed protein product [Tuber aestivum]|uniref:LSM domain-containing protein n=1 Tax=Tuber aestivum TaxID=59557 RepID=A0A292Q4I9_9PEZI|nr:unnamed protein product [Tuber aestivum]
MSDPQETSDPSTFLGEIIGAPITVKLNSGVEYKGANPSTSRGYVVELMFPVAGGLIGELSSVDGYMNIALEKTVEYVGGQMPRDGGYGGWGRLEL